MQGGSVTSTKGKAERKTKGEVESREICWVFSVGRKVAGGHRQKLTEKPGMSAARDTENSLQNDQLP